LFNSNNFATSAALAEVCTQTSVILVFNASITIHQHGPAIHSGTRYRFQNPSDSRVSKEPKGRALVGGDIELRFGSRFR